MIERLKLRVVVLGHGAVFIYRLEILEIAHQKLDGFVKDLVRLARHGAKVLLKFKLLEKQKLTFSEFSRWTANSPCLTKSNVVFLACQISQLGLNNCALSLPKRGLLTAKRTTFLTIKRDI